MRRGTLAALALASSWAAVLAAPFVASGCQGHECDADYVKLGFADVLPGDAGLGPCPDFGDMIDENTWESSRLAEPWIPFPHQRTVFIHPCQLPFREYVQTIAYVSPSPNPVVDGDNYTVGSGNIAELHYEGKASPVPGAFNAPNNPDGGTDVLSVHNDTCADYYLRVVITARPLPDAAPPAPPPMPTDDAGDASADAAGDAGDGAP